MLTMHGVGFLRKKASHERIQDFLQKSLHKFDSQTRIVQTRIVRTFI